MKKIILILSVFMVVSCSKEEEDPAVAARPATNSTFPANLIGLWDLNYVNSGGLISFYTGTGSQLELTDTPSPIGYGYYISYGMINGANNYPSQFQWRFNTGGNQLIDNAYAINNLTSSNLELQYITTLLSYGKTNWTPTTITMEVEFSNYPSGQGVNQILWPGIPTDLQDVVPGQLIYSKTINYPIIPSLGQLLFQTYPAGGILSTDVTVTKRYKIDNVLIATTTQVSTSGGPLLDVKDFSLTFSNL